MYHFFVEPEQVTGQEVVITGNDVNHIRNVLRMKPGDEVLISDGAGLDMHCQITDITPEEIRCQILDTASARSESPVKFYLFQGLPKSDKLEHIIQKSVELGVYEIIPVETVRSVVRYDAKKQKSKQERWQKIAESAAKQSNRGIIPEVKEILGFDAALEYARSADGNGLDLILIPYENYKDMNATKEVIETIRPGMRVGIFIGPEGGFDPSEVEKAMGASAVPISLGNRILRTETAPLMLLSVLTFALEA